MKTVLVSGASGVIGYGILRSIRKSNLNIKLIGTTIYQDSPAQGFCDIFELAPKTIESGYIDWLVQTIEKHKVDLIIPGIEVDMYYWAEKFEEISKSGVKIVLNRPELISLCKDKWLFYEHLLRTEPLYAIKTSLNRNFEELSDILGVPFLLKPRRGHGSKGIVRVDSQQTFSIYSMLVGSELMAQTLVGSDENEFSSSAFCNGEGEFNASMSLRRRLSNGGFTEKAEVVNSGEINEALGRLTRVYKPIGPTNFQFRLHENGLKLLEINPRISSATSIRTAFGYNESEMAINYYLDKIEPSQPKIRQGRAVRYFEDLIFYK